MDTEKLVYMANQIGKFFHVQGDAAEIDGVYNHIKKYWDPRMRKEILAHIDAGGAGLDPNVLAGLKKLKK
jgi:formate dehydrogenase subunit delta